LRLARTLMDDLGVNVAGVDIILRLKEHIATLETELEAAKEEIKRLRDAGL
jgi:MerR family transcriptional regulator/heat shock protein HspR